MTKKKYLLLFLAILAVAIFLMRRETHDMSGPLAPTPLPKKEEPLAKPQVDVQNLTIDGKKVLGLKPGKEKDEIQQLKIANTDSSDWEEKLEESLRAQGGSSLGDIQIKKIESLILAQDGLAINATSAIVTVENDKKEKTTFRVLVDSETGKILQNWDQPVIDPINPREGFGIKLDPRYHDD